MTLKVTLSKSPSLCIYFFICKIKKMIMPTHKVFVRILEYLQSTQYHTVPACDSSDFLLYTYCVPRTNPPPLDWVLLSPLLQSSEVNSKSLSW